MKTVAMGLGRYARFGTFLAALILALFFHAQSGAAPYAAMVMDARNGEVLHSRNADTRLHPASLTKMMTLYVVFEAVENGEISLDTRVKISRKAASEPPSKLGLSSGQQIALRFLIRAAAVKSANDAATALAEAIEGSEAAFARRMNRTAKALGMTRTTFKNAHGLTESGHLSTARDMTILGRRLFFDYPEYYNLFARTSTNAGIKNVNNTNRRLLNSYRGADGIKTGYTRAAGFNLVASAERGNERIIATVFGGRSTATRNARVAELLDMGFDRADTHVALRVPAKPVYGTTTRASGIVTASLRPQPRPGQELSGDLLLAIQQGVEDSVAQTQTEVVAQAAPVAPKPRPVPDEPAQVAEVAVARDAPQIVTRVSTSGGRHWGVNVGRFTTRHEAEKVLLRTALTELGMLDEALRKVANTPQGFEANFVGLSEDQASMVCRRLTARSVNCATIGPG